MHSLSHKQLETMMNHDSKFRLINVLPAEEFERKHIPGSVNIPVSQDNFVKKIEQKYDKDEIIVLYCSNKICDASTKAAKLLDDAGFERVYDFEGGMQEWEEEGHSVVQKLAS